MLARTAATGLLAKIVGCYAWRRSAALRAPRCMRRLALAWALVLVMAAAGARAEDPGRDPARLAEGWIAYYEAASGIPEGLLLAVAITESGRWIDGRLRPWPWTTNARGQGVHHASAEEAARHIRALSRTGVLSIDIGALQLNWRWHRGRFAGSDPLAALNVRDNVKAAAQFLVELRRRHGSWTEAVARYHGFEPRRRAYLCATYRELLRLRSAAASAAARAYCGARLR